MTRCAPSGGLCAAVVRFLNVGQSEELFLPHREAHPLTSKGCTKQRSSDPAAVGPDAQVVFQ